MPPFLFSMSPNTELSMEKGTRRNEGSRPLLFRVPKQGEGRANCLGGEQLSPQISPCSPPPPLSVTGRISDFAKQIGKSYLCGLIWDYLFYHVRSQLKLSNCTYDTVAIHKFEVISKEIRATVSHSKALIPRCPEMPNSQSPHGFFHWAVQAAASGSGLPGPFYESLGLLALESPWLLEQVEVSGWRCRCQLALGGKDRSSLTA